MIKLECKGVYDSLHVLHLCFTHYTCCVCVWHTCFTVYNYCEPVNGIDLMDLIDFYYFKDLILWNYLSDFNETYTHYERGCVELIYQFSSNSKFW